MTPLYKPIKCILVYSQNCFTFQIIQFLKYSMEFREIVARWLSKNGCKISWKSHYSWTAMKKTQKSANFFQIKKGMPSCVKYYLDPRHWPGFQTYDWSGSLFPPINAWDLSLGSLPRISGATRFYIFTPYLLKAAVSLASAIRFLPVPAGFLSFATLQNWLTIRVL